MRFFAKICSFYTLIINVVRKIFKKVKKILARNQKSSTFAPAFGRNEGSRKRGNGSGRRSSLKV
jgi:hypothetical protein